MRIGIIGAGTVGSTLGKGWAKHGHQVMYGVRDPRGTSASRVLAATGTGAQVGSVSDAAAFGTAVVLATPWQATRDALAAAGDLDGKPLLDCTNPLKPDLSDLETGHTSAAEQIATWVPRARVVKIFNTTGAENMANPVYAGQAATMFYCGDDGAAKEIAAGLARDLGFEPVDAGPLTSARLLEPLAMLWITLAFRQGLGRTFAFKVLRH